MCGTAGRGSRGSFPSRLPPTRGRKRGLRASWPPAERRPLPSAPAPLRRDPPAPSPVRQHPESCQRRRRCCCGPGHAHRHAVGPPFRSSFGLVRSRLKGVFGWSVGEFRVENSPMERSEHCPSVSLVPFHTALGAAQNVGEIAQVGNIQKQCYMQMI